MRKCPVITAPEQWRIVKKLLTTTLAREPRERSAYLDQVCTEPSVRRDVESLMAAHEQADSTFPESPAAERTRLEPGAKLGSYEIIALLAAGGMGAVYR